MHGTQSTLELRVARRRAALLFPLLLSIGLLAGSGCSAGDSEANTAGASPAATETVAAPPAKAAPAKAGPGEGERRKPRGRPLPGFGGLTLAGDDLQVSELLGKRLLLFFFNPEVDEAKTTARAVATVAAERQSHNFNVLGVGIGSDRDRVRSFANEVGFDFPIIDDSSAKIVRALRLRDPVLLLGTDAEGYMSFGLPPASKEPGAVEILETRLRESLRLPAANSSEAARDLLQYAHAPDFSAARLGGGDRFEFSELDGKPKVLIFFLHTCPHCHHALEALRDQLAAMPEDKRPELRGVSISGSASAVRQSLEEKDLDFFEVLSDRDQALRNQYGVFGGVPVVLLIDADGRIRHRVQGWNDRDAALTKMWLAKIADTKVPMLLSPTGYTGSDACGVCHELEYATWELTQHASAYDTLVTHGNDSEGECVSCHVVGYGQPGGYSFENSPAHLEGVGCESCHGRGGPHLSPGQTVDAKGSYEATCQGCHNPTHSLGFEYAEFRPRISHTGIASLSPDERAALVAAHGKVRDVLPKGAAYVGSAACQSCHAAEYATWESSPHGHALDTLEKKGEASNADCLRCHTTGFGRPGGFPSDGAPADHPKLAQVGCESCHGPGGDHVGESAPKLGTIVSLGDKCDSCVILQICGSCHDQANDADFEFSVQEHIDRQRHGTIEAGTGKPKGQQAREEALREGLRARLDELAQESAEAGEPLS